MSPRKWSGQEGENSIVIFRFIEVSKVDRCAGYGFLLVSPTQEGYTGGLASLATKAALATWLSSFPREKERRILLSFHARCLTLIFLFLFLVKDKIFFSRRYPSCYRSLNTVNMSIRYRLNDTFSMKTRRGDCVSDIINAFLSILIYSFTLIIALYYFA